MLRRFSAGNFFSGSLEWNRHVVRSGGQKCYITCLCLCIETILSRAHGVAAAVDREVNSGDEAGSVRRQEGDALGHFIHLPWSAQGVGLLTLGEELRSGEN